MAFGEDEILLLSGRGSAAGVHSGCCHRSLTGQLKGQTFTFLQFLILESKVQAVKIWSHFILFFPCASEPWSFFSGEVIFPIGSGSPS